MVQTKQPNIILIVVDQMRADALSLNSKDKLVILNIRYDG